MDVLLSMSPEDGVKFLRQFYAKDEGNYFLGIKAEDIPVPVQKLNQPSLLIARSKKAK